MRRLFLICAMAAGLLAAPCRAETTYSPSPAVNAEVRRALLAKLAQTDKPEAARLEALLDRQDLRALWARTVAADGLHPNDVADAVAADWVLAWLIVHRRTDDTAAQVQGVRRQVAAALDANAAFQGSADAARQRMAEPLIYDFVLQFAAYDAATKRHDEAALQRLAEAAEARMLATAKLDMRRLALSDAGLVAPAPTPQPAPPPPQSTPPQSTPPRPAAPVDRVLVAHWFGITPTGLSNTYDVYVLFHDGTVTLNPSAPPGEVAKRPATSGRWREADGAITFTWPARRAGQQTERKKSDELSACRAAEPGLTLDGDYSHTGGSGPMIPGGIVTLSEADLHLHRDGAFDQASATAVGGAGIGGGVTGPNRRGRYRLDGYAIEFERSGGPPERRFFCRYTDDDTMIFVGDTPWLIRKR